MTIPVQIGDVITFLYSDNSFNVLTSKHKEALPIAKDVIRVWVNKILVYTKE